MILEVCVDKVQSAINAFRGGAGRLELCQDLCVGGTTPSKGLVLETMRAVPLPIMAMIRPRGGDFCYDHYEFYGMLEDIRLMKELGVPGIVTGILTREGKIDMLRMEKVMMEASGLEVVFHRAFDMTQDIFSSLSDLEELGVTRVLTAGGFNKAPEGILEIEKLLQRGSSVTIMPGSGITGENLLNFTKIGVKEIHLSGKEKVDSLMTYRKPGISMGAQDPESEYLLEEASEEIIFKVSEILSTLK